MSQLVPIGSPQLPAIVVAAGERASMRFLEFFAANIRNPHTRRAYYRAAEEFLAWSAVAGVPLLDGHKAHRRSGHRFADRRGVGRVGFAALDIRRHV
jgi:hypothetical protein